MQFEVVPTLEAQRGLLDEPRGMGRFRKYLEVLTGGTNDIRLPIGSFNPMSKEHVAAALDGLIALDAEAIAREVAAGAAARLADVDLTFKVALVVADDLKGGWTHRHLTDAQHRLQPSAMVKRGWAVALLWVSEEPGEAAVREAVGTTIHRAVQVAKRGEPRTLREAMAQEGAAMAFARATAPVLAEAELQRVRAAIAPHLDSDAYPVVFTALYGDETGAAVGYPPLGVPTMGGFAVAIADARAAAESA